MQPYMKAIAAALASFLLVLVPQLIAGGGIDTVSLQAPLEALVVAVLTALVVYLVPNKPATKVRGRSASSGRVRRR